MNELVGIAIRELNSRLGLPNDDFRSLTIQHQLCVGCYCVFSLNGYNVHVHNGKCSMHPHQAEGGFSHPFSCFI
jgi:hypothetical protein